MNNEKSGENNIYSCYPSQMLDENTPKNSGNYINNGANFNQNNANFNQNGGNFNGQNGDGNSNNSSQNNGLNFGSLFQNGGNMLSNIMSMLSQKKPDASGGGNNMMSMLSNILPNLPKNNGAGILGSLFKNNEKKDDAKPATEANNVSSKINDYKKIKNLD